MFRHHEGRGAVPQRLTRFSAHATALVVAIGLASYSSVSHGLPSNLLRLGVANPQAQSMAQGGRVSNVALSRDGIVYQPTTMPTRTLLSHDPITYVVASGDNLQSIATKFNVTEDEIRWSNPWMGTLTRVSAGDRVLIPPIAGVVVQARRGDTVQSLAAAWHVDPSSIIDFNYLRDPVADLTQGRLLVLPAGRGATLTPQPTSAYLPAAIGSHATFAIKVGGTVGPYAVTRFPYGQCTYYVATRVLIPWLGNAWQWYGAAQSIGWAVGTTPRPGAIMVDWESRIFGHVAYVESVNPDGSWVVSEMNFVGWGVIDQRTIRPGQVPLIGFIYPPN